MDKGFQVLERLIHLTNIRHKTLAGNIANSDTPGYKARDISFKGVVNEEMITLKRTAPGHVESASGENGVKTVEERGGPWVDGNNVEVDMEMAKMTDNALLHEAGTRLLSIKIGMFRAAVRRR